MVHKNIIMKTKFFKTVIVFCVLLISACKIHKWSYPDKSILEKRNTFYIVDTVMFKDPVRVWCYKYNGFFIIEREKLKTFNNKRSFFNQEDVILEGRDFYGDLPKFYYTENKIPKNVKQSEYLRSNIKVEGLEVYEFKEKPKYFLIALISDNYYYLKYDTEKQFNYLNNNFNVVYFRLAYPIAE